MGWTGVYRRVDEGVEKAGVIVSSDRYVDLGVLEWELV
jgi:hypothetical protein